MLVTLDALPAAAAASPAEHSTRDKQRRTPAVSSAIDDPLPADDTIRQQSSLQTMLSGKHAGHSAGHKRISYPGLPPSVGEESPLPLPTAGGEGLLPLPTADSSPVIEGSSGKKIRPKNTFYCMCHFHLLF